MKAKHIFLAAFALLAFVACDKDKAVTDPPINNASDRVALQVTSGIGTRAVGNKWQAGDAIGIFMLETGTLNISESAENCKYVTADGDSKFTTTAQQNIYFPTNGSKVDFIAYYPHQELTDGKMTVNVSDQQNLPAIDLMTAKTTSTVESPLDKNHPTVDFNFSHKLTKLELNISNGAGLEAKDLEGLKVEITNQHTIATYAPLTETLAIATSQTVSTVTLNTNATGTYAEAILLSNSTDLNPPISGRELIFSLSATGESFRYSIPDTKTFNAGDRNIYNITINRRGLVVTATITDWTPISGGGVIDIY